MDKKEGQKAGGVDDRPFSFSGQQATVEGPQVIHMGRKKPDFWFLFSIFFLSGRKSRNHCLDGRALLLLWPRDGRKIREERLNERRGRKGRADEYVIPTNALIVQNHYFNFKFPKNVTILPCRFFIYCQYIYYAYKQVSIEFLTVVGSASTREDNKARYRTNKAGTFIA